MEEGGEAAKTRVGEYRCRRRLQGFRGVGQ